MEHLWVNHGFNQAVSSKAGFSKMVSVIVSAKSQRRQSKGRDTMQSQAKPSKAKEPKKKTKQRKATQRETKQGNDKQGETAKQTGAM